MDEEQIALPTDPHEEEIPATSAPDTPLVINKPVVAPAPEPVVGEPVASKLPSESAASHSISEGSPINVEEANVAPIPDSAIPETPTTHPSPITVTDISAPPPIINTPETIPEPIVTEPTPPEPQPILAPVLVVPPAPEPPLTPNSSPVTATFDVALLSDDQLKAAAVLYTKRNQAEISRKGVAKRQETMELNLREIVDYLSLNNGSPLPRIAKNTNITLGTTSKYLRQLQSKGKVRAEGWGKTRRYYLK